MVIDNNINYLRKFIMLYSKKILDFSTYLAFTEKLVLKSIQEFTRKDGVCAVWTIFLKTARNWHNRSTAGQWQTSHITHCWEHWCSQWLVLSKKSAPGTHKTTRQTARETGISRRSVGHIIHKDIQLKCLKKRWKHCREANEASLIKQLIGGEIVLMRVSKPKANSLNICCDVNLLCRLLFV